MVSFIEFLNNFPSVGFCVSALNLVFILGILHWFPWSYHIGRKLSNYEAFLSGCLGIVGGFIKFALIVTGPEAWVTLAAILILFHWPLWTIPRFRTWGRIRSFFVASIAPLLVFGAWAIGRGEVYSAVAVAGLYVVGWLATLGFYQLDKWGESKNVHRINGD
jgi:hypothetical protein